ncbi:MAG TPA: ABC transporter permease subunit [Thermomicrobiaceae bacterium]|nr:ABC transporter permease subunit [Thermomicrobiaceae bacterium]
MSLSRQRVGAIVRKELREFRRSRSIVPSMAVLPLLFVVVVLLEATSQPASVLRHNPLLLYLLGVPVLLPVVLAGYTVASERQQGTLEPVLTTPIRGDELLLGKTLAVLLPTLALSYAWYAVVAVGVALLARPGVPAALFRLPDVVALLLFTPLLAGWSIWIGIAISTRLNDARAAQQLGSLASLPAIAVTILVVADVIPATLGLSLGLAAVLLVLNGLGWWVMATLFDRERLVAGTR